MTADEVAMLKDTHLNTHLADGWFFNGYLYVDIDGKSQLEHPNLELIIREYVDEQNKLIGEFNREVQKEWKNDALQYDS